MLTVERARELLSYDSETGILRWKQDRLSGANHRICRAKAGDVAGSISVEGYATVSIDNKNYRAHRVIWLIAFGVWPDAEIDHANGNPSDNRLANLRLCTPHQNRANMKVRRTNVSGLKGVSQKRDGSFETRIRVNGVRIFLGRFMDATAAHEAYKAAASKHFGQFARFE